MVNMALDLEYPSFGKRHNSLPEIALPALRCAAIQSGRRFSVFSRILILASIGPERTGRETIEVPLQTPATHCYPRSGYSGRCVTRAYNGSQISPPKPSAPQ